MATESTISDTAVNREGLSIPLIDFSLFTGGDPAQCEATGQAIVHGFRTAGFVYLRNHGISEPELARAYELSARFFAQPMEAKMAIAWEGPTANRGYSAPGREKLTTDPTEVERLREAMPDLKESFEIYHDEPGSPQPWPEPSAVPDFAPAMVSFRQAFLALHIKLMRAIALGMSLPAHFFDRLVDGDDNTLRLLHYPAVSPAVFRANPDTVRAGAHSDYGSVTFLFQDNRGGLQVQSRTGAFVDAPPIQGTVVVNAGDLLARWSNDTIRSTVHRVVEPPPVAGRAGRGGGGGNEDDGDGPREHPARYSIVCFCNPNFGTVIEALPGTYGGEEDKKYGPVTSGEYLRQRLAASY